MMSLVRLLGVFAFLGCVKLGLTAGDEQAIFVNSGGQLVTSEMGSRAFETPYRNQKAKDLKRFAKGHDFFNELWVLAPAPGVWGLGPTFNEANCAGCHPRNSRANPIADGAPLEAGNLVRLGISDPSDPSNSLPHPIYGDQLQDKAAENRVPFEGRARVDYDRQIFEYADGSSVELRKPVLTFTELNFGPLGDEIQISMRIAPQVIGLGLLNSVSEEELLNIAQHQPEYGVSGRPNYVLDLETERVVIGRFGWKAAQPNLKQQTASAFHSDIGATTFFFPEKNCPAAQIGCRELPSAAKCGGQGGCTGNQFRPEVLPSRLKSIVHYLDSLNIPARRIDDIQLIKEGEKFFQRIGCSVCHVQRLTAGPDFSIEELRGMAFFPYTDLLLHDMGEGLADNRSEGEASGSEWRTPPLWGLGLIKSISGDLGLMHDGRAGSVEEAILWHGGEAKRSRDAFASLLKSEREALISFVKSL